MDQRNADLAKRNAAFEETMANISKSILGE
jgi:hypothetical protein